MPKQCQHNRGSFCHGLLKKSKEIVHELCHCVVVNFCVVDIIFCTVSMSDRSLVALCFVSSSQDLLTVSPFFP